MREVEAPGVHILHNVALGPMYEENLDIESCECGMKLLTISCSSRHSTHSIELDRDEVQEVRDYLTQWLEDES